MLAPMKYQYKRVPLNLDQVHALEHACLTFEDKLLVWLLLDTGLRIGEWQSLTPQNVNWQERTLTIFGKGSRSQSKRRTVPVSNRSMALLEKHFAIRNDMNCSVRSAQRRVKSIANRAHIATPVSPHVLRHTFAILALMKGFSLPALQKILGHENLETTAIYLNVQDMHVIDEYRTKW